MPEGNTIHCAAKRVGAALVDSEIQIFEKTGRPCPRCGARLRSRGQGDERRTTHWCPGCQA